MLAFCILSFAAISGFALIIGVQALQIPGMAGTWPLVLVGLVLLGSLVTAGRDIANRAAVTPAGGDAGKLLKARGGDAARLAAFCLLWLVFPWVLAQLGFVVRATVWIVLSLCLLHLGRLWLAGLVAGVIVLCFSVLFATLFYIPVPQGPIDAWISLTSYTMMR